MALRPIQGVALSEIVQWGGGLFPIRIGGGKTLISFLAPRVAPSAKRPLLLLPASLREKTKHEMRLLRRHWKLPPFMRIESYEMLSTKSGADLLAAYEPDTIVCDEAHMLKNPSAACTARLARYVRARRKSGELLTLIVMSGTIMTTSVKDFAHLGHWAIPRTSPIPADFNALDEWSRALDIKVTPRRRLAPGALSTLRHTPTEPVRSAFRRRLVESPGVVATQEAPLPIGLTICSHAIELDPALTSAYETLRSDWVTPDEWMVEDGVAMWRHARELARGFYSRWNPRPPDDWRDARRAWGSECREIVTTNRRQLDTERQARDAVWEGLYPHALPALRRWTDIAPSFEPNAEAVWVSDKTVNWIAEWARANSPALIWTERPAIGRRLADLHGLCYYGSLGVDAKTGRFIERHDPERMGSAVVSIDSNSTGRNLQAWSRNLIVDVRQSGADWEQMLGRTHRDGQKACTVDVDVLFGCIEDVRGFWKAVEVSGGTDDMTGQAQKLVHADVEGVEGVEQAELRDGPAWRKT